MKFGARFIFAALATAVAWMSGCGGEDTLLRAPTPATRTTQDYVYRRLDPDACRVAPPPPAPPRHERPALRVLPPVAPGWEPRVRVRPWRWIVVHHSATEAGNAAVFDHWHRHGNHWDELGYHFVIGNGTDSGDGEIEIGSRWLKQKHGAHCRVGNDQTYNQTGIGICLVGDFEKTSPTPAQMASLTALVDWLTSRFRIGDRHVIGHGTVGDTKCPGRHFSFAELTRRLCARREARRP